VLASIGHSVNQRGDENINTIDGEALMNYPSPGRDYTQIAGTNDT
jgi:hypothetical protein